MQETWVFDRRIIQLPGLIIDRHRSTPTVLDFSGCDHHVLCLLLTDGNQQKLTRIGDQQSEQSQAKGEFWICPATVSGCWVWDSTDESLMFVIDPKFLEQTAQEVSELRTDKVELLATIGTYDPQIQAIARLFLAELEANSLGSQLYLESLAQLFLIHLLRQYCAFQSKQSQKLPDIRLQSVLDYIHSSLDQSLHLAELAEISGVSQYHFCRLFKQSIGVSPHQYVLQQRIEKAKGLLTQRKHTIAEVALELGFSDQSRFTKQFRKCVGVTPGKFLKQQ
jgi:AraC family transcriptional regulator